MGGSAATAIRIEMLRGNSHLAFFFNSDSVAIDTIVPPDLSWAGVGDKNCSDGPTLD